MHHTTLNGLTPSAELALYREGFLSRNDVLSAVEDGEKRWIMNELLETYGRIKNVVVFYGRACCAKGKKRLRYAYLNEKLDGILEKGMSEDAKKLGLSVKRDDFFCRTRALSRLFRGRVRRPAVILRSKSPKYRIFVDAEHGTEHAGPETILRMIDEWQAGKFLPEIAGELEIYALPMYDLAFPNHSIYGNCYRSYKRYHSGELIGKKLKGYRDLFISLHQTSNSRGLTLIAPNYARGTRMGKVAKCAKGTMENWRETQYFCANDAAPHYAYRKLDIPYLILELDFETYEERVQAPEIGLDVLKATISEFVKQKEL